MATEKISAASSEKVNPAVAQTMSGDFSAMAAGDLLTDKTVFIAFSTAIGQAWTAAKAAGVGTNGGTSINSYLSLARATALNAATDLTNAQNEIAHYDACNTLIAALRTQEKSIQTTNQTSLKAVATAIEAWSTTLNNKKLRLAMQANTTTVAGTDKVVTIAQAAGPNFAAITNGWTAAFIDLWRAALSEELSVPVNHFIRSADGPPVVWSSNATPNLVTPVYGSTLKLQPVLVSGSDIVITTINYIKADGTGTEAKNYEGNNRIVLPITADGTGGMTNYAGVALSSLENGSKLYKGISSVIATGGTNNDSFLVWMI